MWFVYAELFSNLGRVKGVGVLAQENVAFIPEPGNKANQNFLNEFPVFTAKAWEAALQLCPVVWHWEL